MSTTHPGRILPQDVTAEDGWDEVLTALPLSQAEIEELLYGDDRPPAKRIERLQELAGQLRNDTPGDFGDGDPEALLREIDGAVARLRGDMERDPDLVFDEVSADDDPRNHRETLSPDSDELDAIEDDDRASLTDGAEPLADDALAPEERDDDDRYDADRGGR